MKTRRDFLKKAALFGASAFTAPSLLGQEREEACFFSPESTSSMLVPMGDALKITGTFLDEVSHVNPEKPDVPLNKNDAFQKVQKRRVQEKR